MSEQRNKKIFAASFAVSVFLHVLTVVFCSQYTFWFASAKKIEEADWLGKISKQERDEILKSSFDQIVQKEEAAESEQVCSLHTSMAIKAPENAPVFQNPVWPKEQMTQSIAFLPSFSLPTDPFNLLEHLPKELIISRSQWTSPPVTFPMKVQSEFTLSKSVPKMEAPEVSVEYPEPKELAKMEAPRMLKPNTEAWLPNFPRLPTLDELDTTSYSDSFDVDLVFLPKEDEKGYLFALTLIPRDELELPRIRQHVTFLIDRSNSIQQGRLSATKAAVHKALEELQEEDTFNIIAFDSKMEKLSPSALPYTSKSLAMAEGFLEKLQLGSFFSSSDLYRPLFLTVPGQVQNDELHTAILITDGESLGRKNAQVSLLRDWTQYNQGRVSLYVVGMNDAHSAVLETAAVLNQGKFLNAPATRGIKRKLLKLMKTIQTPIAKNISCKAISHSPQTKVELLASHMPNLYLDQPYAIVGEAETLDDFILFVQGRLKGRWINIKKTISFINAKKGNRSLKEEWAHLRVNSLYEHYLIDQDANHLVEAKMLLEPFDLPVAIQ